MRTAENIEGLIRERGSKGLPLERVYRLLFNPMLYLEAYGKIYRNAGAMTKGTTDETVDAMSTEKIGKIIEALRNETYRWQPARRVYIEKKNSTKKRPLGMPTWSDKLVQEAMRLILNAYYEPQFSDHSHGFRPERGCHTALREIYYQWPGTVWFIEGDISQCFDKLDHTIMLETLREKIHDGRFIRLVQELLEAGYLEDWRWNETISGSPQGGIISPLLANIYLDKLDKYVENELIPRYTKGEKKAANPEYNKLNCRSWYLHKKGRIEEARKVRRIAQEMPTQITDDPNFRRLRYVRYADDFLLGFIGSKEEAEEIKQSIGKFLEETLKLEMSQAKTLITNARTEAAAFLGYEIRTYQANHKQTGGERSINGGVELRIPEKVLKAKCQKYMRNGKPIHRAERIHDSNLTIVATYQSEYRGLVEYYKLAHNIHDLNRLKWIMERSLTSTLASKNRTSVSSIWQKFGARFIIDGRSYKGLQIVVPREGKEPLKANWGGIPLKRDPKATIKDQKKPIAYTHSELVQRLLANECEYCGSKQEIQVHHIRALKDLKKYAGREKPEWVKIMAARNRKTMVLCRTCHQDVTYGRPMRNQRVIKEKAR